jgi:tripartite-type tricarboxylate transporter receptor subunit TctC
VPKATPRAIVARLNTEITKVLESVDVKERMAANGGATIQPGPAAFTALLERDLAKWSRIIKEAKVRID